jgi:hypothetical protein
MAEETSTKVAPMTENGNNCPTSEQAANPVRKELWPPFPGSERVRESYAVRYASKFADVPARRGSRPGARRNPTHENSVHTYSTSCARIAIEGSL